jgi:hypothetical protein
MPKTPNPIFSERLKTLLKKHAHSEPSTKQSLLNPREKAAVTLAMVVCFIHKQNKCSSPRWWRGETKVEVKSRDRDLRRCEDLKSGILAGIMINLYRKGSSKKWLSGLERRDVVRYMYRAERSGTREVWISKSIKVAHMLKRHNMIDAVKS